MQATSRHSNLRTPLVDPQHFIQSARDSGYKGTAAAVSELVDNALEAKAKVVRVLTTDRGKLTDPEAYLAVLDDGTGMDGEALRVALQFGGSSRYGSRIGLGRFGMGLPGSSLSRARRVTVFSWRSPTSIYSSFLDIDAIASGAMKHVPDPQLARLPETFEKYASRTGTLVVWSRCDRLDAVRPSTLRGHLTGQLGRIFRYFLLRGHTIRINDEPVPAIDPLFLEKTSRFTGAAPYGDSLIFDISLPGRERISSRVEVRFSELPIEAWHSLPVAEKRAMGIVKGAGLSIVRAAREIDYGWLLLPNKRRENYDDWWRCEVRFEPVLDELFGVAYTKQGVHPSAYLSSILSPEIEETVRRLNARVRGRFTRVRSSENQSPSEATAARNDRFLPPVRSRRGRGGDKRVLAKLSGQQCAKPFTLLASPLRDSSFFSVAHDNGRIVVVINTEHPFYSRVYRHFEDDHCHAEGKKGLELMLMAAARAELGLGSKAGRQLKNFRIQWSNILSALMGD